MGTYYVDSNASGANDGSSWTDAFDSLDTASDNITEDSLYLVEYRHSKNYSSGESIAFSTYNIRITSVDKDNSNAYRTGASESASANDYYISVNGKKAIIEGLSFSTTNDYDIRPGLNSTSSDQYEFIDCTFDLGSAGEMECCISGTSRAVYKFTACSFSRSSAIGSLFKGTRSQLIIRNCDFSSVADSLARLDDAGTGEVLIEDCDLSTFDAMKSSVSSKVTIRRCRVRSGVSLWSGAIASDVQTCILEYCSASAITATPLPLYRHEELGGAAEADTTNYLTASDGENSYSYKMTTGSSASLRTPLVLPHVLTLWHDASGSKTLTVYCGSDDSGLYDDDVWIESSWNDESATAYATGTYISTRPAYGAEAAAGTSTYLKTDSSTWTGTGPSTKYKFVLTGINPIEPGPIVVRVSVAKPSINFWVCPNLELTAE